MIRSRIQTDMATRVTRESLERSSMRILSRRYGKTKKTIMRMIHEVAKYLPDSRSIKKKFLPSWSGILVFDGKVVRVYDKLSTQLKQSSLSEDELLWMNKMRWLVGVDYGTGDLPHYDLAAAESKIDLVMFFRTLRELNYPLQALICDGNPSIPEAAKFVFGDKIVVQLCTRHFMEGLRRELPQEADLKKREKLEALLTHIQSVIEADDIEAAETNIEILRAYAKTFRHHLKDQFIRLFRDHTNELCAHVLHPELKLPHTSNDAENLIRQLNQRLKSLGRFFNLHYAHDYLKAWALLRRFTPFTDCRSARKYRNGKAPLELAGCEIKNIDPMRLRQEPS
jgi:hypothetical protein